MLLKKLTLSVLVSSLFFAAGLAQAADQVQDQTQDRTRLQDQIYGSQLMTEQEREEHRTKMRSLRTVQERKTYQLEHQKLMQQRAKEKGITLSNEPAMKPGGMGYGGGGMEPGGRK